MMGQRRTGGRHHLAVALVAAGILVGACAETELVIHAAKHMGNAGGAQQPQSYYKVGEPYRVNGVYYRPAVDYGYRQVGVASWYGPKFHGRSTANGEIFDMNALTAAHRTLPLPSFVRVTNLRNGRMLVLRINDRGPFVNDRIIDLSRRAAQLLGFRNRGTVRVRVEILAEASRRAAVIAQRGLIPNARLVAAADANGIVKTRPARDAARTRLKVRPVVARSGGPLTQNGKGKPVAGLSDLYVQAASFAERVNAARARARLGLMAPAHVVEAKIDGRRFYRVWLGPIAGGDMADHLLARVSASGYPEARIVKD